MAISRRALLGSAAGMAFLAALNPSFTLAASNKARLVGYNGRGGKSPSLSKSANTSTNSVSVAKGDVPLLRYTQFKGPGGTDQWPMTGVGGDKYLAAGGDGPGFSWRSGWKKRDHMVFARLEVDKTGSGDFEFRSGSGSNDADLSGLTPKRYSGDNYKPSAVLYDQKRGEAYTYVARGDSKSYGNNPRRAVWLIQSTNKGKSWNESKLPDYRKNTAVFDARRGDGLTVIGSCSWPNGSVNGNYAYLYFNGQGNIKSDGLYKSKNSDNTKVYLARVNMAKLGSNSQRRFEAMNDPDNYEFWTGGGWSSGGGVSTSSATSTLSAEDLGIKWNNSSNGKLAKKYFEKARHNAANDMPYNFGKHHNLYAKYAKKANIKVVSKSKIEDSVKGATVSNSKSSAKSGGSAKPIHTASKPMGKHFLVHYSPDLKKYVASYTLNRNDVWVGVASKPWGPFNKVFEDRVMKPKSGSIVKFTSQVLPKPAITDKNSVTLPLVFSGRPSEFDGFFVAKIQIPR